MDVDKMEDNDEPLSNGDVEINDESAVAVRDASNNADSSRNDDENPSNNNSNVMNEYRNLVSSLIEIQELRDEMRLVDARIQQLKVEIERNQVTHNLMIETFNSQPEGLRSFISVMHQVSVEDGEDVENITFVDVIQIITDNAYFQSEED